MLAVDDMKLLLPGINSMLYLCELSYDKTCVVLRY